MLSTTRERVAAFVALGVTLAVALTILLAQPIRSPWWIYADADGTYTGSALELASNNHARYVDHPGLPIQEALAVSFDAEWLVAKAVDGTSHAAFMRDRLLHLDRARGTFRAWAIAFYLLGAVLACVLVARLLRSWLWGGVAGVLWVGMPAGALDAIQIRPETLLSLLCLVVMFLVTRGAERRSARLYGWAGVVLGVAGMVKLHAFGLVVPLALAALVAAPPEGWRDELQAGARGFVDRHRLAVGAVVALWLLLALRYTAPHFPFHGLSKGGAAVAFLLVVVLVGHWLLARRVRSRWLDPFHTYVAAAVVAGIALPVSLAVDDGLRALGSTRATLMGNGVNAGIKPFDLANIHFTDFPLREALVVFALAGVAAAVGIWKRELFPVLWFVAAAVLGVMASARLGTTRYFAPPFVVSIPAALWLLQRLRIAGVVVAAALVLFVATPQLQHRDDQARDAKKAEQIAAVDALVAPHVPRHDAVLVPDGSPHPDALYFSVVQPYLAQDVTYPYRFLPDTAAAHGYAAAHGLRLRHFRTGVGWTNYPPLAPAR
jgi:hypothetical protein